MLNKGDEVRCVDASPIGWSLCSALLKGQLYTVADCRLNINGVALVHIEGNQQAYCASRFELVTATQNSQVSAMSGGGQSSLATGNSQQVMQPQISGPDPTQPQPYPDPEKDREKTAEEKLRAYKRGMRNYLYGTTSEGEN